MKNIKCQYDDIGAEAMNEYKSQIIIAMKKMGASGKELLLIQDGTIRNAIKRGRNPEDVAWAILR